MPTYEKNYKKTSEREEVVVGHAYVTICKKCGGDTYGSHKLYAASCLHCGAAGDDVEIKQSDREVYGYED